MPAKTLHVRYVEREIQVASGTPLAAPQAFTWDLGVVHLLAVRVRIPPGPLGLAGIAVLAGNVAILPFSGRGALTATTEAFFRGDDADWVFDVALDVDLPLTVRAYNTDIYAHTFILRATVTDGPADPAAGRPVLLVGVAEAAPGSVPGAAELLGELPAEPVGPDGEPLPGSVGQQSPGAGGPPAVQDGSEVKAVVLVRQPGSPDVYVVAGGQLLHLNHTVFVTYGKALGVDQEKLVLEFPPGSPIWSLPVNGAAPSQPAPGREPGPTPL